MAYLAKDEYTANAGQAAYTLTFDYLETTHVKATVDAVANADFTVSGSTLTFAAPTYPFVGTEALVLYRETPNTVSGLLVDYEDGTVFGEAELDRSQKQLLYVAQELADRVTDLE